MDEYLLFEYLLFNIHFSPCKVLKYDINVLDITDDFLETATEYIRCVSLS